jgi:PST family polysaccharide transporter
MGAIATIGQLGILWTCSAVGVVFVLRTLLLMWTIQRLDGVPMRRFLLPLIRPLIACLLMVAVIELARPALLELRPISRLAVEIAIGAAVYLAGARLIFRDAAADLIHMVRSALFRR